MSLFITAYASAGELLLSPGFHAGRIAWASEHCQNGKPSLAARFLIETWTGSPDFDTGSRDAAEAGDVDLTGACQAIDALYGAEGLIAQGLWMHGVDGKPPQS